MNLAEFKAWFEGFSSNIDACPSVSQWETLKRKVSSLNTYQHIQNDPFKIPNWNISGPAVVC